MVWGWVGVGLVGSWVPGFVGFLVDFFAGFFWFGLVAAKAPANDSFHRVLFGCHQPVSKVEAGWIPCLGLVATQGLVPAIRFLNLLDLFSVEWLDIPFKQQVKCLADLKTDSPGVSHFLLGVSGQLVNG